MRKIILAFSLMGFSVTALSSCYAKENKIMNHQLPSGVSLAFGNTSGDNLWAFAAKTPLFELGKPIQLDSEYVVYQFDFDARLLSESPLGAGSLRATEVDGNNGLALIVVGLRGEKPESILYLTSDSGKTWATTTAVPSAAVGAKFLSQHRIAVWSETDVFVTEDLGSTWNRIQSNSSQLSFSSVKVPISMEAVGGVPLVGIEYEKESRKTYSKLGVLRLDGKFVVKNSVEGRVIDMKQDGRGRFWILVFEEGENPQTKVYVMDNFIGNVRLQEMRKIPESIPQSLSIVNDTILVVYARWVVGARMPLAFTEGASGDEDGEFAWRTSDFKNSNPSKVFFSEKNGVWLYTKMDNGLSYQRR